MKGKISKVEAALPSETLRIVQQTSKAGAGASNWLSVIPLAEQGFVLNKQECRDALSFRFNRPLQDLPSNCPCGQKFDINHAMNCKRGGFIIMHHNNLRDFEINLLSKVCKDVESEPPLLPLGGENLPKSTIKGDKARLDIRARGFWRPAQNNFFDVRITNPSSASSRNSTIKKIFNEHEQEKKHAYNHRVMEVEHGTFTPLIFTIHGSTSTECTIFHNNLAEKNS